MFKIKKIKFNLKKRNFRWDSKLQDYVYECLNETELHRLIIKYCNLNNITLKSIKIFFDTCTIKIKGTEQDKINLILYITDICNGYIDDLQY